MNEELYDRAVDLLGRCADEFEQLAEVEIDVKLPDELETAWYNAQAFTAAIRELSLQEPEFANWREKLVAEFRIARDEADPLPDVTVKGPAVDDAVLDAVEALVEELRRDRLLS